MPKTYSSAQVVKVLRQHGFTLVRQRGSHAKYRKGNGQTYIVIVPMGRKDLKYGTFTSILQQAGLSAEEFQGDKAT